MTNPYRRCGGAVDGDFYRQRAQRERSAYIRALVSEAAPSLPELSPGAKRKLTLSAAALAMATAAFWAIMLVSPPQSSAAQTEASGVPVFEMMRHAPADLPALEADAI